MLTFLHRADGDSPFDQIFFYLAHREHVVVKQGGRQGSIRLAFLQDGGEMFQAARPDQKP